MQGATRPSAGRSQPTANATIRPRSSAIALAEDHVDRSQDRDDIADHVAGQEFRNDAQIDEGGGADLEAVGNSTSLAVDVETKLSLRILCAKINLSSGRVDALGGDDEVVDELLHLLENLFLGWKGALAVDNIDRTIGNGVDRLTEDAEALAHLLDAD